MDSNQFVKPSKSHCQKLLTVCVTFTICKEAAIGIYEADRHAKKELKKQVRGVRAIEHSVSNDANIQTEVVQDYCLAVRSALTSDGRPPLDASGLQLQKRLTQIL